MFQVFQFILAALGGGTGGWLMTEVVKAVPFIPINAGQTARIRTAAAVLSSLSVVLMDIVGKNLDVTSIQGLLSALSQFALAWGLSHIIHKTLNPSSNP